MNGYDEMDEPERERVRPQWWHNLNALRAARAQAWVEARELRRRAKALAKAAAREAQVVAFLATLPPLPEVRLPRPDYEGMYARYLRLTARLSDPGPEDGQAHPQTKQDP